MTTPETGAAPSEAGPQSPDASPEAPAAAPAQAAAPTAPSGPVTNGTTGRTRRGAPRTYDFRRPTKLSREHVRVLQIAQEAFARQATTILTTFLRAGARLELNGIEQFSYDDYVQTLPNPIFISTFVLTCQTPFHARGRERSFRRTTTSLGSEPRIDGSPPPRNTDW